LQFHVCQLASDQLLLTGESKRCGGKVDCWLLNLVNKTWTEKLPLYNHCSVTLDQYVYVFCGRDASMKVTGFMERFYVMQHQWLSMPDILQSVSSPLANGLRS